MKISKFTKLFKDMNKKFLLLFVCAIIPFMIMRVMEQQYEKQSGRDFDIMEFELPGSAENLTLLIQNWQDAPSKEFLLNQLYIDFFFMLLLFPAIACLCFWAAGATKQLVDKGFRSFVPVYKGMQTLGYSQFLALSMDLSENFRLIHYVSESGTSEIFLFEIMVRLKFAIVILGITASMLTLATTTFWRAKNKNRLSLKADS
jgi:hypothetical protein